VPNVTKFGSPNLLELLGHTWTVTGLLYLYILLPRPRLHIMNDIFSRYLSKIFYPVPPFFKNSVEAFEKSVVDTVTVCSYFLLLFQSSDTQSWALHELLSLLFPKVMLTFYCPPKYLILYTKVHILFLPTRTFIQLQNFIMACQGVVSLTDEHLLPMKTIGDSRRVHSCTESVPITSQRKLQPCPISHSESHSSTNCSPIFHRFLLHNSPSSQPLLTFIVSLVQSSTHNVKLFNGL